MALAVTRQGNTSLADPTAPLRNSLHAFENALTDTQKQEFHAVTPTPDACSTIAFITQLDACNAAKQRKGVALRLHAFLESLRQFTRVIDTFISSNPKTAALLWGGVRLTLISANNVVSYFEKVTNTIMRVGRSCPTYKQFSELYPHHPGVQHALCEYYAIVVRMCTKIMEVSQRSALTSTISAIIYPFESDFKPFIEALDEARKEIHLQLLHASCAANDEMRGLLAAEQKDNSSHRLSALQFMKKTREDSAEAREWRIRKTDRDIAKSRSTLLQNLSTIDHAKPWKQAMRQRATGTTEWVQCEPALSAWMCDARSATLWCSGAMGIGKTVLTSSVVAHLHSSRKPGDVISYYFRSNDNESSPSARNLLGSIVRQLLESHIERASGEALQAFLNDSQSLGVDELVDFVLSRLEDKVTHYIIIDGLDECENAVIKATVSSIAKLTERHTGVLKVLFSGRPELGNELSKDIRPRYRIGITKEKVGQDMDQYIISELDRYLEEEHLTLGDSSTIVEIQKALNEKAKGMFLWTRLAIEELIIQGSDSEILGALDRLPSGLSELFAQKIDRVKSRARSEAAIKTLQVCGVAKRPLTVTELQEYLSIDLGQKSLDRTKMQNDMYSVIRDCGGMVFIDEEDETTHYVHHSVKAHLYGLNGSNTSEFSLEHSDKELGSICMTYLNFTDFKRQLTRAKTGTDMYVRPLELGVNPVAQSNRHIKKAAQLLLRYGTQAQQLSIQQLEGNTQVRFRELQAAQLDELQKQQFRFLEYCKALWIYHLKDLREDENQAMWNLFSRYLRGNDESACKPWETSGENLTAKESYSSMLEWALIQQHGALARHQCLTEDSLATGDDKYKALKFSMKYAIERNSQSLLRLANGLYYRDVGEQRDRGLVIAIEEQHTDLVALFLEAGSDANVVIDPVTGATAVHIAAKQGCVEIVQKLVAHGSNFDCELKDGSRMPLHSAAEHGHATTVNVLLVAGADVNCRTKHDWFTPLHFAAQSGHDVVVKVLLAAGIDIDCGTQAMCYRPLHLAAQKGHKLVVDVLLAAGANVNCQSKDFRETPLHLAAKTGHELVVEVLLDAGADVDCQVRGDLYTPLHYAALQGHKLVVDMLLAAGADVNCLTKFSRATPLSMAAEGGHKLVIEVLLAIGAK